MLAAIQHPAVRILAHPRGRITGSRAGVNARWDMVFAAAADRGVEDAPSVARAARQCMIEVLSWAFAFDSDARSLRMRKLRWAHPRLAGISLDRIVNCWPLHDLLAWLSNPSSSRP